MDVGFQPAGKGVRLRLGAEELLMVGILTEQLLVLLGRRAEDSGPDSGDPELPDLGIAEHAEAPDDPVLARLFPDAYREDPEAAQDFRRYTEAALRDGKREAAEVVLAGLRDANPDEEIVLDEAQAQCWLRALNDVRLMLGTRLEITDEEDSGPPGGLDWEDPRFALFAAYDWLTALQDGLVRALW